MNKQILSKIRKELKQKVEISYRDGAIRFFKEEIKPYGVRTPIVRKMAKKYWQEIKDLEKQEIFKLCENLLDTGYFEETTIAFAWARKLQKKYVKKDFLMFEKWLEKYVNNWAFCDDFCTHIINYFLIEYPEAVRRVKAWAKSDNRWLRRAAAVSFISPNYREIAAYKKHVFDVATILLKDEDDLVQKGYGWMLKVASLGYEEDVFNFVIKNKKEMPRTALRYAIEHMPKNLKIKAMEK